MARYCGECTYLDLTTGDIYGKFYCEKRYERHGASDLECSNFCTAYSRSSSEINNAIEYTKDHTSSGCYLTTIVCNILGLPDNNIFLNTLRKFRNNILQKNDKYKTLLLEYDIIGPKIAESLNNDPLKKNIASMCLNNYIINIVENIELENYEDAINKYIEMTNKLRNLYNIDSINISTLEIKDVNIKDLGHGKYQKKLLYTTK